MNTCEKCNGTGREEAPRLGNPSGTECSVCHGNGFVSEQVEQSPKKKTVRKSVAKKVVAKVKKLLKK